jgi:hypothetical protein
VLLAYKLNFYPALQCAAIRVNAEDDAGQATASELPDMPIIPTIVYLYPQNTQVIELDGLQDSVTLDFSNAAAVSGTLYDQYGNPDAVLQNVPMTFVPASNGNYRGIVSDTFDAALGSGYRLEIQATSDGSEAVWSIPAQVKLRDG